MTAKAGYSPLSNRLAVCPFVRRPTNGAIFALRKIIARNYPACTLFLFADPDHEPGVSFNSVGAAIDPLTQVLDREGVIRFGDQDRFYRSFDVARSFADKYLLTARRRRYGNA